MSLSGDKRYSRVQARMLGTSDYILFNLKYFLIYYDLRRYIAPLPYNACPHAFISDEKEAQARVYSSTF